MSLIDETNSLNMQEVGLYSDLIDEYIDIFGHECIYVPSSIEKDLVLQEETKMHYESSYEIKLVTPNIEAFMNQADLVTNFGIQYSDSADFYMSIRQFPLNDRPRPLAGDLIYHKLSKVLFKINAVPHRFNYVSLNAKTTFKLKCSVYASDYQDFNTGNELLDYLMNPIKVNQDDLQESANHRRNAPKVKNILNPFDGL